MSTVAAGMLVKDEADVIVQTIGHLHDQGVVHVYVLDNGSTDGTSALLAAMPPWWNVTVLPDPEPGYYQSDKMTSLMYLAWKEGHEWFVPCDADELWRAQTAPDHKLIDVLLTQPDHVRAVYAALYDHFPTARDDMQELDPFRRLVWRAKEPQGLPKVAVRCSPMTVIEMGNHGAYGWINNRREDLVHAEGRPLRIDHYPYRSADQFIRKARNGAAAYRAAPDLPESAGQHWKAYGDILDASGEAGLRNHFREHFYYEIPERELVKDYTPVRRAS